MTQSMQIRTAAVLGGGVMGSQIAAHLANAGIQTYLFDLPAKEGNPNAIAQTGIANLAKLKPAPLASADRAQYIKPANYQDNLEALKHCDLVIEAIAERLDWKRDLFNKIAPHLGDHTVLVTNTSGLSVNELANALPEKIRPRFFGCHFFNPPRYMHLVELIATKHSRAELLNEMETFLVTTLGKGVVRAKDTPNFIANRVGIFSMLATMYHAVQYNIPFEIVDELTGPIIGRPKSATFRTADVVGLDTMVHAIKTLTDNLPNDPWHKYYESPAWLLELVKLGALGQKTGAGIYKKVGKDIQVLDLKLKNYRPATEKADASVIEILKIKNPKEKIAKLRQSNHDQAKFLWACFRDLFHYSAFHLMEIADNVREIDLAIRWGFGWQVGPFELWQMADWKEVATAINEEIRQGKTMAEVNFPSWVMDLATPVYQPNGAYSPVTQNYQPRSNLPVYKRQLFPETVLAEKCDEGETIFENPSLRYWHQHDGIGIVSFKTKMNTIDDGVLNGLQEALKHAQTHYKGLVLWQREGADFSAGANLLMLAQTVQAKGPQAADAIVNLFQQTAIALRYATVPVVAAVKGRVFGGGCEFMMHCDRTVAALETYVGLVEMGVGLLPAGGGTKEFALRASQQNSNPDDRLNQVLKSYQVIAMAEVSGSAEEAKQKGFLRPSDIVIFNADEILFVAKQQALALFESGYRPPVSPIFPVVGKPGIANILMQLVNLREGGFISAYDFEIGKKIAEVICGGEVEANSMVSEQWMLDLERRAFIELLGNPLTQARIKHLLETGKPLRN